MGYVTYKERVRVSSIEAEIDKLKGEAERVKGANIDLKEKIAYFETESFQEREAKDKLNLQKPGEQVVIIKENPYGRSENAGPAGTPESQVDRQSSIPNYVKWWNYFFKE